MPQFLTEYAEIFAQLSLIDRERLITSRINPNMRGVIRTLFLRAPIMPHSDSHE